MIEKHLRCLAASVLALTLAAGAPTAFSADKDKDKDRNNNGNNAETTTPIRHVVVIFQENISFDHYFATYPMATNQGNEPKFFAKDGTPRPNNLLTQGLLDQNPNSTQPFRLDRTQAVTCDQNHDYGPEQAAFNKGLMDKFPENVGFGGGPNGGAVPPGGKASCNDAGKGPGITMGYFDGNTVTAFWNYAQRFAMSDNSFGTTFGPSTPGALNLVAGTTSNAMVTNGLSPAGNLAGSQTAGPVIGDPDPSGDDCASATRTQITVGNGQKNIGDLLNAKNITWGWFQGGFAPSSHTAAGKAVCGATSVGLPGTITDYSAHHAAFQYFASTLNAHHVPASDPSMIGKTDQAKHEYDLADFFTALNEGRLPAVSFLKAKAVNDGHPGNSDPLDEQTFIVNTINQLQQSDFWKETAVIIAYDDSDGWYDHQMDPIVNQSAVADDALTAPGACGVAPANDPFKGGRCGFGPRLPLLVISPFSKENYIDHLPTDQSSIIHFIEDNWGLGRIGGDSNDARSGTLNGLFDFENPNKKQFLLDPASGLVLRGGNN
ncbi:MAG TPA: alkaline phosphatase family protein [Candidatus Acidoferrum sp.]|jgi:phospholipase C